MAKSIPTSIKINDMIYTYPSENAAKKALNNWMNRVVNKINLKLDSRQG